MTEVTHLYKFVPKGRKKSNKSKDIPCSSDSIDPTKSTKKAYNNIRVLIDNYAARNYWEIGSAVSTYSDKGWKTSVRFNNEVSNFGFVEDVKTKRENDEIYHIIKTDSDIKFVEKFLNSYYRESKSYYIENADNGVVIYEQWRTEINNT